jgi:long-chain fatty acid transport protein
MVRRHRFFASYVFCAAILCSTHSAFAGGLYIQEFATPSMGTADAGSQAWADNASTAWHNPAGMTKLKRSEVSAGLGFGRSKVQFDADADTPTGGNDGGDAGSTAPLASLSGVYKINEDWAAGIYAGGITGAALDYNGGWAGRFQAEDVTLTLAGISPTVAYRVTDWLSIGGGPVLVYGTLDYELAVPPPAGTGRVDIEDADDIDVAGMVGAVIDLSDRTRIGIVYQSESELELEGNTTVDPPGASFSSTLQLVFPQKANIGIYHDIDEQFAVLGSIRWEDWSSFDEIPVSTEQGSNAIPRNWRDTYGISLGLHYKPIESLLLQAGFGYDTSPVSDGNRTADMPVDRQIRYAIGAQYSISDRATIGGSVVYVDLGDADIDAATISGSYENNQVIFAAMNFGWKF